MDSDDGEELAPPHLKEMTFSTVVACVGYLLQVLWWDVSFRKPFPPRRLLTVFLIHLTHVQEMEKYSLPVTEKKATPLIMKFSHD